MVYKLERVCVGFLCSMSETYDGAVLFVAVVEPTRHILPVWRLAVVNVICSAIVLITFYFSHYGHPIHIPLTF